MNRCIHRLFHSCGSRLHAGPPQYQAIGGTSLQYIANSDAAMLRDRSAGRFYFLVSGRWFSATSLAGPWTFGTDSLPADSTRIPANGPRGFLLVSVPGTPQAQEALIQARIPQQAAPSTGRTAASRNVAQPTTPTPAHGRSVALCTAQRWRRRILPHTTHRAAVMRTAAQPGGRTVPLAMGRARRARSSRACCAHRSSRPGDRATSIACPHRLACRRGAHVCDSRPAS
jgi:hypothetical protein